jgi:hypothetical protein
MPSVITPCGGGSGGGIQFDTYPQAGHWLYVETTDATGSPHGYGIELKSADDTFFFVNGTTFFNALNADWHFSGTDPAFKLRTNSEMQFINLLDASTIDFHGWQFLVDTTSYSAGNNVTMTADRLLFDTTGGGNGDIQITAQKELRLTSNATNVTAFANSGTISLQASVLTFTSFTQQTAVTTLGDVIALLQSYGLAA